ncbi:MAG: polysaccharide lyase [Pirellulaceae bacterium]|nr:polysaccharide lyase [Pirellulaceae bacterium]
MCSCFVLILVNVGCDRPADSNDREQELAYLRVLMPTELLPHAHVEVPGLENIAILGEGVEQHLGLRLYPGQKQRNRGNRAEVSLDWPYQEGDTVRYEWRFRVPEDFKSDAPQNRWWIIGQWHDQPDLNRGETWENFPSRSPPILVGIGEMDGRTAIAIEYGPTQADKQGPIFIERGQWHQLAFVIHWSQQVDGTADVYLDDMARPIHSYSGPNMHNGFQHYLKIGMYRDPAIATDCWIHVANLKVEAVSKPDPQSAPPTAAK